MIFMSKFPHSIQSVPRAATATRTRIVEPISPRERH